MKQFQEDEDTKESLPHNQNGPSDPTLMEQLEKLEESVPFRRFKRYISDAILSNYVAQSIKKKSSSLNVNNSASDYSEDTVTFENNDNKEEKTPILPVTIEKDKVETDAKEEKEKDNEMQLTIIGCVEIKFLVPYVKYEINVYEKKTNSNITVFRRYCEFENLRRALVNKYACMYTPPLPGKILFGYLDQNLIEKRKKFLQIFLHELQYLFYYFDDSPEIKEFLDPSVHYYSGNNILDLYQIISMDHEESLAYLTSYADIAKKTFTFSLQNIHDKIVQKLREPYMANPEKLASVVVRNYPRKIMKKSQMKITDFVNKLHHQKKVVCNIFTIVESIKMKAKEHQSAENAFYEQLLSFQSEYIANISFGKKAIPSIETKGIREQIARVSITKPLYVLTKNISDWISREDTIIMAYCECINKLNHFISKEREVKTEMKGIKQSKNRMKKREELVKLTNLSHLLNEILILNTIYVHDVRIDRYKYSRFQLYYNALHFSIDKNKENILLSNRLNDLIGKQLIKFQISVKHSRN